MKTILSTLLSASLSVAAFAQVPGLINYQGRLTDANGSPVTGSKSFAISIYDAATDGNLLYSESIGAVNLDSNGVYSFQFGNSGTSNTQVTETIGTTAGSTLTYTKTLSSTPVVANSITVTDGTNSWSQSVGNPGVAATATANTISGFVIGAAVVNGGSGYTSAPAVTITGSGSGASATATVAGGVVTGISINSAGSGYTGGATITIAPPVIPFRVDYNGGAITATYSSAPSAGRTITATYRYGTSGITSALASGAEQWMAISVDGTVQGSRQRVLAVPFALKAQTADFAREATDTEARRQLSLMLTSINSGGSAIVTKVLTSQSNYSGDRIQASYFRSTVFTGSSSGSAQVSPVPGSSRKADFFLIEPGFNTSSGWYEVEYSDGEVARYAISNSSQIVLPNPYPAKDVAFVRASVASSPYQAGVTIGIFTQERATAVYSVSGSPSVQRAAFTVSSSNGSDISDLELIIELLNGKTIKTIPGYFVELGSPVQKITISATSSLFNASFSTVKINF